MDIPSLMAPAAATGKSPVKKVLGTTSPPAKPSTSGHTHVPAELAAQGRGRSPACLQVGSEQNHHCSPQRMSPQASAASVFHHLSDNGVRQPSTERLPVLQQQLGSIQPSIHLSVCPGNGLNSPCLTPQGQPGLPGMGGRGLQLRLIMGAAIKRVETLPPTLIRRASQLHALEPRDEVQSLFTTSCETGEFFPCQGESWLIPPRRNVLRASPK